MTETSRTIGKQVEQRALDFLTKQGLRYKESNYQRKMGEIDLIMEDGECLVFVEVRFRDSGDYGGALASISRGKQKKIIQTAKLYLLEHDLYDKVFCRFDVVTGETINNEFIITWLKNAFMENFV